MSAVLARGLTTRHQLQKAHLYSCESKLVCTCAMLPPSCAALASAARSYARAAAASVAKKPRCTCK